MRGRDGTGAAGDGNGCFQALSDAVPSPVLVVDAGVRILDYNAAGAVLLGPDRQTLLRKLEFSHSICEECRKAHYGDVMGGGSPAPSSPSGGR